MNWCFTLEAFSPAEGVCNSLTLALLLASTYMQYSSSIQKSVNSFPWGIFAITCNCGPLLGAFSWLHSLWLCSQLCLCWVWSSFLISIPFVSVSQSTLLRSLSSDSKIDWFNNNCFSLSLSLFCRPIKNFLSSQETGEAVETPGQSQTGRQTHKALSHLEQSVSEQIEIWGGLKLCISYKDLPYRAP